MDLDATQNNGDRFGSLTLECISLTKLLTVFTNFFLYDCNKII